jgi:predicted DsbA family dithiol-disulfide isomerase
MAEAEAEAHRIVIDYFSDMLCVWAWVAQPRLDELRAAWGDRVTIRFRFVDVFGDAHGKIRSQWGEDDGFARFGAHLQDVALSQPHAPVHAAVWADTRPHSSLPAHLLVKAAELVAGPEAAAGYALGIRRGFFGNGLDVSQRTVLLELARAVPTIDPTALSSAVDDGSALAALSRDSREAEVRRVRGSPTWVLNDGRQILYGNVGYRILSANIEELLHRDAGAASWC